MHVGADCAATHRRRPSETPPPRISSIPGERGVLPHASMSKCPFRRLTAAADVFFWGRFGVRRAGLKLGNIRCFLRQSRHPQCARRVSKHQESVQLVCAHQLLHPFPCDSLTQLSVLPFKTACRGVTQSDTLSSCASTWG